MKKSIVLLLLSLGFISCSKNRNLPYDSEAFKQNEAKIAKEAALLQAKVAADKIKAEEKALLVKEEAEKAAKEEAKITIVSDEVAKFTAEQRQKAIKEIKAVLVANQDVMDDLNEMMKSKQEISEDKFDIQECTDSIRIVIEEELDDPAEVNVSTETVNSLGPVEDKKVIKDMLLKIEIKGEEYKFTVSELLKK